MSDRLLETGIALPTGRGSSCHGTPVRPHADRLVGLDYFPFRYLSAGQGRFTSRILTVLDLTWNSRRAGTCMPTL